MSNNNNEFGSGFGSQLAGNVNYGGSDTTHGTPSPSATVENNTKPVKVLPPSGLIADLAEKSSSEPVLDISTAQFMAEVVDYSRNKPVLVDFWAPWCGPCKQLTPIIEEVVAKAGGKVRLVKMNIDDHPEVAGQMGIQSIPAVVAFVDGQPKDAFMGAKTRSEVEAFVEKLAGPSGPSEVELALADAAELMKPEASQEELAQALELYNAVIGAEPNNLDAIAGFGLASLRLGDTEQAKEVLATAESIYVSSNPAGHSDATPTHSGLMSLKAALELVEQANSVGAYQDLIDAVEKDPKDHASRFDLAIALNAAGKREEAADHLLEIMRLNRNWNDDAAKQQLIKFFEAWGNADPATSSSRRKLSTLLFS